MQDLKGMTAYRSVGPKASHLLNVDVDRNFQSNEQALTTDSHIYLPCIYIYIISYFLPYQHP
jgi:hypothetical protein